MDDVLELTRRLVATDSQNPGAFEPAVVELITDICAAEGFATTRVEPTRGRPNLIVTVDAGPGPHLGLSGHVDTKPVGDALAEWDTDPFTLTVDGDLAYGLGASDMKGGVAAMLVAARNFADTARSGRLSLVLTADEEQGSEHGAKALAANGLPDLDAVVIGEPSGMSRPWEALHVVSRGICCFEVEVRSRQGHSGLSGQLGRNAIQFAADLVRAFENFDPPVDEPGPIPCSPTVNPGMLISGGVSFGTWPGRCTVGIELRLAPGMSRERVRAAIAELVRNTVGDAAIRYRPGSQGWMPAVTLAPDQPVVDAARRATARVFGAPLPLAAYPGATDATYFIAAGVPAVTSLGPGWLSVAHGPNECVGVTQLHQGAALYSALAEEFTTVQERKPHDQDRDHQ
jgi:succinyl-diaminopimelate desuccinylase